MKFRKTLYCSGCNIVVAKIVAGSKLKKGMVALCEDCETKRNASDLAATNKRNDLIEKLFGKAFMYDD